MMKTLITATLIVAFFFSCKSGDSLTKAETMAKIAEQVESSRYTFVPQTAHPMGGRAINITSSYELKVTKDTISAYLPYFGRAYTAPYPTDEGGIKFVSTNFSYETKDNGKGQWYTTIGIKDDRRNVQLTLDIGNTGYATLTVRDNTRQPISFYGRIE
ncbi:hypothetical protein M2451_003000 [Dysgonomonas sp. PFB1-18]|uniref:DUF4251 domain-containing protein n=1 Tax=unclassified Dysgonomonas TaxID=2630389 RepID=UPI002473C29F|nr:MULTISPECIES: DUF4251 domain-containing protein [unclassified Dysgonomonas]MDH6310108.1 hypothetical protein [Dysgonomonas sp. PF1-14]MDH6340226.1 hypothetical protein [Dysgonomonas sp. PF1-16]MDH6381665.1 hypothetical protein [Dysgonomonas sp. PFB1-18]MDH6399024.1 hypothetical protein [Dysgonomonas sp. PF1-23]